ncbi:MAG: hypothetical protein IPH59_05425 [bacterium]|nr:hypothetical protein [bacterium]
MIGDNRKLVSILIIALLLLLVAGFNIALYLLYTRSLDTLDRSLGDRLLSVGRAIAPEIEGVLQYETPEDPLSLATVVRLQDYLVRIRDSDALSAIYLLDAEHRDMLSLDDSISNVQLFLPLHIEGLSRAALGNAGVSELNRAGNRYFKSAYQPVGEDPVYGVLLIESNFEFFTEFEDFKQYMIVVNAAAIGFLLFVSIVVVILNRRLIQAEKMLVSQAALSQMGQMAAVIAHEVRNPLAIIKATAERLKKKYASGESSDAQLFDFIPEEVDRLNTITTHYLQFASPIDAPGKVQNLSEVVESVVQGMSKEFEQKGVKLHADCESSITSCKVDSQKVRQILVNLMKNALDVSPEGATVNVTAGTARSGILSITISDTGAGIEKKVMKHIFDPFFTTKSQGTGLGLFVVKRLVDNMKGEIRINSQVGVGTSVTVTFPERIDGEDSRS